MTSIPSLPPQIEAVRDVLGSYEAMAGPGASRSVILWRAVLVTLQHLEAEVARPSETAGEDYERGVQAGMKLSADHIERLEAMARRANESLKLLIRELTDPGTEALAAQWELERALAALGTAAPETPDTDTELALSHKDVAENSGGRR